MLIEVVWGLTSLDPFQPFHTLAM